VGRRCDGSRHDRRPTRRGERSERASAGELRFTTSRQPRMCGASVTPANTATSRRQHVLPAAGARCDPVGSSLLETDLASSRGRGDRAVSLPRQGHHGDHWPTRRGREDPQRTGHHGHPGWMAWLGLHLFYLVGFRNRLRVFINWTWRYFDWPSGPRLIVADAETAK